MMNQFKLHRAEMFAAYSGKPVLYVRGMLGVDQESWFIALNWAPANPSGHIHYNELREGLCINDQMEMAQELDKDAFNTKLLDIHKSNVSFPNMLPWAIIK